MSAAEDIGEVREELHAYLRTPHDMLPMRVRPARPVGDDALYELCRTNRDLRIERTADGELIVMPPTGGETGSRNLELTTELGLWVRSHGGRGFDSSTGFLLPNGAERSPDAAWVRQDRWDALSDEQRRKFPPLAPDFVAELRSPSDGLVDLRAKMREYVEQGAQLGWLLDPTDRSVYVYRPGEAEEHLADPERLEGDPVLPGFVLELSRIWSTG